MYEGSKTEVGKMSLTYWFLVSNGGTRHRLPREMIFVGRDDCELMLQSRSVDKQHAVINYDAAIDEHLVKDLGSLNGTFINDTRIPEQIYLTLKREDKLRFGYDTNLFTVVRGEMKVPEEALKHEKFTSQLQFTQKLFETEESKCKIDTNIPVEGQYKALERVKTEEKLAELSAVPRGTPLYGQPSWWGDEDAIGNANKQECYYKEAKKSAQQMTVTKEEKGTGVVGDPSYFEIPSKELQKKTEMENYTNEMTAQDSHCGSISGAGHASFTIEFDEASPGKITIKDHITKFTDQRQKAKKPLSSAENDIPGLNIEMIAAESKVADWLVQNNPPRVLNEVAEKDTKSIKSDVPVYLKKLRGSKHEDGTQSDYENSATLKHINTCANLQNIANYRPTEHGGLGQEIHTAGNQQQSASQTAFLIELFDDDHPKKRRSNSFSLNNSTVGLEAPYPIPQSRIEKVKTFSVDPKGICMDVQSGLSSHRVVHSTQNAKLMLKHKSEEPCSSLLLSQNVLLRSSGSFGHRPEDIRVKPENIESSSVEVNKKNSHIRESANRKDNTGESSMMDITASCRKHWASQWASLASNHVGHEQDNGQNATKTSSFKHDLSESGTSHTSEIGQSDKRKRHLPKLPNNGASSHVSPSKCISRSDNGEKQDTELQEKGLYIHLSNKNGLCGSNVLAMSKQVKPTDSRIAEKTGALKDYSGLVNEVFKKDGVSSFKKQAVYKIQHEQARERLTSVKMVYKPPVIPSSVSASSSSNAQKLPKYAEISKKTGHTTEVVLTNNVKKIEADTKETIKPLVRQGSFTIDKPSSNVPIELIPHINKQQVLSPTLPFASVNIRERSDSLDTNSSLDTTLLLKDTEAVMAFLEAKLQDDCKIDDDPKTPSYTQENSISPESDVDTASTISFIANDTDKKSTQKRKTISGLHKEQFSMPTPAKELLCSSATLSKERIERRGKTHVREAGGRTDIQRVFLTSERNRPPSIDLTDDDQISSLPCSAVSDILSSDQETYSVKMFSSSDDKFTALKTAAPNKSVTLPRPRPTRTSLLRRSRLGEASDTDVADTDKASVASDVSTTSSTSKQPSSKKTLSRIDLLAQPRRARLGSLSARSDSEATTTRCSGSSRNSEYTLRSGVKITPTTDGRRSPRARANSISRLSDGKGKTVPPAYSSAVANSRWKRIPHEYASTSEDEFGSNRNSLKTSRLRTTSTIKFQRSQITGGSSVKIPSGALSVTASKHKAKEQGDYIHDWTAHREEIARISQDLALIAREINDVAGEIDSVTSSGTAPSTTVSTAATTPGSAIDTREELVDRVFDESLNFRKIPSSNPCVSEIHFRAGDLKPRSKEGSEPQVITRRKAWCRDEVMGDSLLLSSVFQFSQKIRQTVDKTANKIRILFKDKERNWDEIERKFISEGEIPILKTSCVEILSILQELKKIEKQLQVINTMIDPDGTLDALNMLGLGTSIPSSQLKAKQSSSVYIDNMSLTTVSQTESRSGWLKTTSVASDVDNIESSADFSIQCNRFNPDGKEDSTSQE